MEIIAPRDGLLKLAFPPNCLRCARPSPEGRIQIIETTYWMRRLHQPFSVMSILLFLGSGLLVAGLGQIFEIDLMWTWLFVSVFIVSVLRTFSGKSSRVIAVPYCPSCLKQWEHSCTLEYILVFTFIFASSAAFFVGLHRAYPAAIPVAWALSFVLYFFARKTLSQNDPPLDLRQSPQGSVSLKFENTDFAERCLAMNDALKGARECPDCRAFVARALKKCPKCASAPGDSEA